MDIALCIDRLGLNRNEFTLSSDNPPHTLTRWSGPDPQPTDAELQAAWDAYEAEGGYAKEEAKINRKYAYLEEADPLFYKWKRGEVAKAVWTAKVAEIKTRFPY